MKDQLLVPLDGSMLAEVILPHAVTLALASSLSLVLLRSVPLPFALDSVAWSLPPSSVNVEQWDLEANGAGKYLERIATRLREAGVEVETEVIRDEPARAILAYAEHHPSVKLVAMSTHGRSGLGRWFYGSVAESVLHACPVPLLLVHAHEFENVQTDEEVHVRVADYKTILVPLDGSPFAEQALDKACVLAGVTGAGMVLVTAVPDEPVFNVISQTEAGEGRMEAECLELDLYLDRIADRLKSEGLRVATRLQYGVPSNTILQMSEQVGADLIVMATHGRGGLQRLWLGSVALEVVQGSSKPVLLVHAKERVKEPVPVRTYKRQGVVLGFHQSVTCLRPVFHNPRVAPACIEKMWI